MVLHMINRSVLKWKVKKGIDRCSSRTALLSDFSPVSRINANSRDGVSAGSGQSGAPAQAERGPRRRGRPAGGRLLSPGAQTPPRPRGRGAGSEPARGALGHGPPRAGLGSGREPRR